MCTEVRGRCPRRPQFDLSAVAFLGESAESLREGLCRGARGGVIGRGMRLQSIGEPRPGDLGQQGVHADLGLKRRLRKADDPPGAVPLGGLVRVMQQDEATSSVG